MPSRARPSAASVRRPRGSAASWESDMDRSSPWKATRKTLKERSLRGKEGVEECNHWSAGLAFASNRQQEGQQAARAPERKPQQLDEQQAAGEGLPSAAEQAGGGPGGESAAAMPFLQPPPSPAMPPLHTN